YELRQSLREREFDAWNFAFGVNFGFCAVGNGGSQLAGFAARGRVGGVGNVRNFQLRDGPPQAFQVVKTARFFGENVNDETAEIEQSPVRRALALAMFGLAL